jgi:deoxycytidylate deaminase
MKNEYQFDWTELAFSSKKPIRDLKPIFIAAPREMSHVRFTQLVKELLTKGNLLVGISKEPYVIGLENQPQFKMLQLADVQPVIDKVNKSNFKNKIHTLLYSQRDTKYIFEKINPQKVLLINGSWYNAYHHKPEFYVLVQNNIPYEKLSPFASEQEAMQYPKTVKFPKLVQNGLLSEAEIFDLLKKEAARSFDFGGHQTALVLAKKQGNKYSLLATAHNKVVPYETYAMHHGSVREKNFSPLNDLNFYDTIHAEVELVIKAQKEKINLKGASLFINLLPCPTCARMFAETDLAEIIYQTDHSSGYALNMLELAGKKVKQLNI